jgi:hypothetical protein
VASVPAPLSARLSTSTQARPPGSSACSSINHKPGPQSERHALDSLPVRTRGDRHSGRMEGTGLSAGPAPAEPPCIIGGGATGGSPRPSVRSVNLVSLSRSLAYRHLPSMAREADVIPTGAVLDRALTLNPNGATGWIFRGWFNAFRKSARDDRRLQPGTLSLAAIQRSSEASI